LTAVSIRIVKEVAGAIPALVLAFLTFWAFSWFIGLFPDKLQPTIRLLLLTGGFGGLLYGFTERGHRVELPRYDGSMRVSFGSLADILVGVGAAHAVFFVLAGSIKIDDRDDLPNTLRLLGLGVLSGIGGKSLLAGLQRRLVRQIEELGEKVHEIDLRAQKVAKRNYWYTLAETYRLQRKWDDAMYAYEKAISEDPDYTSALLGLATTLRDHAVQNPRPQEGDELLGKALEYAGQAIAKESTFGMAYVVRAAIHSALGRDEAAIREDLEKAVQLNPELKRFIAEEGGFDGLRSRDWFRALTT
jgi:hypothetical protein